jgi:undecaprenyl-diphosphatase
VEPGSRAGIPAHPWRPAFTRAFVLCAIVWIALEIMALVLGLAVVGRYGGGPIRNWDNTVEQWSIAHRGPLIGIAKVIAFAGDAPFLALIAALVTIVLLLLGQRMRAFVPLVAYLGGEAIVFVTRQVVQRPRPPTANFPAPYAVPGVHETSYSYPSGHATAAVAVIVSLAALAVVAWPRFWAWIVAAVLVLGAVFVAWSRLVLGVHWFSDVAFGMLFGIPWAWRFATSRGRSPGRTMGSAPRARHHVLARAHLLARTMGVGRRRGGGTQDRRR